MKTGRQCALVAAIGMLWVTPCWAARVIAVDFERTSDALVFTMTLDQKPESSQVAGEIDDGSALVLSLKDYEIARWWPNSVDDPLIFRTLVHPSDKSTKAGANEPARPRANIRIRFHEEIGEEVLGAIHFTRGPRSLVFEVPVAALEKSSRRLAQRRYVAALGNHSCGDTPDKTVRGSTDGEGLTEHCDRKGLCETVPNEIRRVPVCAMMGAAAPDQTVRRTAFSAVIRDERPAGLRVRGLDDNGLLAALGLQPGDVVVGLDGERAFTTVGFFDTLLRGQDMTLHIQRRGQSRALSVRFSEPAVARSTTSYEARQDRALADWRTSTTTYRRAPDPVDRMVNAVAYCGIKHLGEHLCAQELRKQFGTGVVSQTAAAATCSAIASELEDRPSSDAESFASILGLLATLGGHENAAKLANFAGFAACVRDVR